MGAERVILFNFVMFIVGIYNIVRSLNLVGSQYEFSEGWLGRCRTYYSAIVSAKREPSIAALTTLKVLSRTPPLTSSRSAILPSA